MEGPEWLAGRACGNVPRGLKSSTVGLRIAYCLYVSIWKQDANEVLDRVALGYLRWMAKHRWLFPILAVAVVLGVILFWVFAGLGWALFVIILMIVPMLVAFITGKRSPTV